MIDIYFLKNRLILRFLAHTIMDAGKSEPHLGRPASWKLSQDFSVVGLRQNFFFWKFAGFYLFLFF